MRKAKGIAAIFAGLLLMFRAGAITVSADEGKGNNGDVKIHEVGTSAADNRNEPHVCNFYIEGFKFDKGQSGTWTIVGQAPTGGNAGTTGAWGPANASGNWQTGPQHLADGHYKLTVNTGKGDGKHKVFWVECGSTTANGEGNVPPTTPGNQNNGNNSGERSDQPTNSKSKAGGSKSGTNSKSKKGGSATGTNSKSKAGSKNTKGGTVNGSVTGTHSVSKGGTKAGTKATNNASVASQGNNASGTNSMQTISREEGSTTTPVTIPAGGGTLPSPVTIPVVTPVVVGGITIPAGSTITLPAGTSITLPNGTVLTGAIPTGTTLPAGTVLPAGTTITGVLGFQSGPQTAPSGAVTPVVEQPNAAVSQPAATAELGVETSPVAGVTSLPSTSTTLDNGIWGALGIMLTGIGAFLLRKPSRRLS